MLDGLTDLLAACLYDKLTAQLNDPWLKKKHDWLTDNDWLTDRPTDRLTDWLTDWQTDCQAVFLTVGWTDWLIATYGMTDWLPSCLLDCGLDWRPGFLSGRMGAQLVNWLTNPSPDWLAAMDCNYHTYQLMNQITKKLLGISMALVRKKFR